MPFPFGKSMKQKANGTIPRGTFFGRMVTMVRNKISKNHSAQIAEALVESEKEREKIEHEQLKKEFNDMVVTEIAKMKMAKIERDVLEFEIDTEKEQLKLVENQMEANLEELEVQFQSELIQIEAQVELIIQELEVEISERESIVQDLSNTVDGVFVLAMCEAERLEKERQELHKSILEDTAFALTEDVVLKRWMRQKRQVECEKIADMALDFYQDWVLNMREAERMEKERQELHKLDIILEDTAFALREVVVLKRWMRQKRTVEYEKMVDMALDFYQDFVLAMCETERLEKERQELHKLEFIMEDAAFALGEEVVLKRWMRQKRTEECEKMAEMALDSLNEDVFSQFFHCEFEQQLMLENPIKKVKIVDVSDGANRSTQVPAGPILSQVSDGPSASDEAPKKSEISHSKIKVPSGPIPSGVSDGPNEEAPKFETNQSTVTLNIQINVEVQIPASLGVSGEPSAIHEANQPKVKVECQVHACPNPSGISDGPNEGAPKLNINECKVTRVDLVSDDQNEVNPDCPNNTGQVPNGPIPSGISAGPTDKAPKLEINQSKVTRVERVSNGDKTQASNECPKKAVQVTAGPIPYGVSDGPKDEAPMLVINQPKVKVECQVHACPNPSGISDGPNEGAPKLDINRSKVTRVERVSNGDQTQASDECPKKAVQVTAGPIPYGISDGPTDKAPMLDINQSKLKVPEGANNAGQVPNGPIPSGVSDAGPTNKALILEIKVMDHVSEGPNRATQVHAGPIPSQVSDGPSESGEAPNKVEMNHSEGNVEDNVSDGPNRATQVHAGPIPSQISDGPSGSDEAPKKVEISQHKLVKVMDHVSEGPNRATQVHAGPIPSQVSDGPSESDKAPNKVEMNHSEVKIVDGPNKASPVPAGPIASGVSDGPSESGEAPKKVEISHSNVKTEDNFSDGPNRASQVPAGPIASGVSDGPSESDEAPKKVEMNHSKVNIVDSVSDGPNRASQVTAGRSPSQVSDGPSESDEAPKKVEMNQHKLAANETTEFIDNNVGDIASVVNDNIPPLSPSNEAATKLSPDNNVQTEINQDNGLSKTAMFMKYIFGKPSASISKEHSQFDSPNIRRLARRKRAKERAKREKLAYGSYD